MTNQQKIIKTKVGILELAKQLGNVSQACKVMGIPATACAGSKHYTKQAAKRRCRKFQSKNRTGKTV